MCSLIRTDSTPASTRHPTHIQQCFTLNKLENLFYYFHSWCRKRKSHRLVRSLVRSLQSASGATPQTTGSEQMLISFRIRFVQTSFVVYLFSEFWIILSRSGIQHLRWTTLEEDFSIVESLWIFWWKIFYCINIDNKFCSRILEEKLLKLQY